jgi:mannose-6-phosphate isomerase
MHAPQSDWYPLQFVPVYKDYLWGGRRLAERYGRDVPPGAVAESWEISAHPDGMSTVAHGPWAGRSLAALAATHGPGLLGARAGGDRFPLLVKLIDAADRLSVQVHPDDAAAARCGGEPKTELWYLLDAAPGAGVFAGLVPGTTPARLRAAVEAGACVELLRRHPVAPGDAVFIPGGRVHAIDRGCLILEVQQSSNTTYRIYDWGRRDARGRARELHLDEAVRVTRWDDTASPLVAPAPLPDAPGARRWLIHEAPYFRMERWVLTAPCRVAADPSSFQALFLADGRTRLDWGRGAIDLRAGESCLIPAALDGFLLDPRGSADLLRVTVPAPR